MERYLGIDCGSVSLNLALMTGGADEPVSVYLRTKGRPLGSFVEAIDELIKVCGGNLPVTSALVTGSARELLSKALNIPAINEISAHATGAHHVIPNVRTIVEIGGQDSKFVKIEPSLTGGIPRIQVFRMNEICAAGTGAFLDEQAERLGIGVESFGALALQSTKPAPIAGRCAVFAKTDMIHQAQEGTPIPDILLGLAFALARNYVATLIRGETSGSGSFPSGRRNEQPGRGSRVSEIAQSGRQACRNLTALQGPRGPRMRGAKQPSEAFARAFPGNTQGNGGLGPSGTLFTLVF